jgi:hypothetical protein
MRWLFSILLVIVASFSYSLSGAAALEGDSKSASSLRCPLRFESLPKTLEATTELPVRLFRVSTLQKVEVIAGRFMVVRSSPEDPSEVYFDYRLESALPTKSYELSWGSSALTWSTAAQPIAEFSAEVVQGHYRIMIEYISPNSNRSNGAIRSCVALSPSFELRRGFLLVSSG